ncbi:phosphodiester glycosidase family protein [Paenibacillus alvei]|uniref:phosphodiester glycosidase family protein n=2 Tax=Paenibacillus alvei TaxID=44250 RepID=UPI00227FC507|nr:phosphodiester glycosidase family protein [Paenibacillus alvei]MCY9707952.1 phosphodiester glycosidase family protein [Paenibacillus alvei]MCY9753631.1 phosphodiester glycosidase family protein [Paenibacillus alvei]MEC0078779.1 phosphodiester glycosidase family protein [Paenibacillus alvei]
MSKAVYSKCTASNGVVLHTLKCSPNDVQLRPCRTNVYSQPLAAINGGYFDFSSGALLSITVQNDKPVKGDRGGYGSGWHNAKYARGTLIWDAAARRYSIQVVKSADELQVSDRSMYWAQGGISMSLQDDAHWQQRARLQNMPNMSGKVYRTGLVYGSGLSLWLVVTNTACNASEFRTAIKQKIGSGALTDGIFLDGSGSSQLRYDSVSLRGDGRTVHSIISIM